MQDGFSKARRSQMNVKVTNMYALYTCSNPRPLTIMKLGIRHGYANIKFHYVIIINCCNGLKRTTAPLDKDTQMHKGL